MRKKKKAILNVMTAFIQQLVVIICEFVITQLFLGVYGSEVNGTVVSIKQFLGVITLLDGGMGGVVRAALYKPLYCNDISRVSTILKSSEQVFKKIAIVFLCYSLILAVIFKAISGSNIEWITVFCLVIIIASNTFSQYYIGLSYALLIQAAQKQYITNVINIFSYVISSVISIVLIQAKCNVMIVKLAATVSFILKPIVLKKYVENKYNIKRNVIPDASALSQRWDAFIHQITFYLNKYLDVILLTLFTDPLEVSVFSVYTMVVHGLQSIIETLSSSVDAFLGELIARGERDDLRKKFGIYELIMSFITFTLFETAFVMILSFVKLYTHGVNDVNYIRPAFAAILVISSICTCIRIPYDTISGSAGHFKQTRNGAVMEVIINLILSLVLIKKYGMVGITAATLTAAIVRTIQFAVYASKNVLYRSMKYFVKRQVVNWSGFVLFVICCQRFYVMENASNYITWGRNASIIFLISLIINTLLNLFFYFKDVVYLKLLLGKGNRDE